MLLGFSGQVGAQLPEAVELVPVFGTNGVNRFATPIGMKEIPGIPGHFAVWELRSGNLYILAPEKNGFAKHLFLHLEVRQGDSQGLIGMAFHPGYAENRRYFVKYYPASGDRRQVIEERAARGDGLGDSGEPGRLVLTIPMPSRYSGHNGGNMEFGPDGFLYFSMADGTNSDNPRDPLFAGQDRSNLRSAISRIDVDNKDPGREYAVPSDNPFAAAKEGVRPEIWIFGLRNPWKWSFDRATGEIWIGDVGALAWDEINLAGRGDNLGWSLFEGNDCVMGRDCSLDTTIHPVLQLGRDKSQAVIGGYVFRGLPDSPLYGTYFFADHASRRVYALRHAGGKLKDWKQVAISPSGFSSFSQDASGNLYGLGEANGAIYRLSHPGLEQNGKPLATAALRRPRGPWIHTQGVQEPGLSSRNGGNHPFMLWMNISGANRDVRGRVFETSKKE